MFVVGILYIRQRCYQLLWHISYRLITGCQVWVYIVDDCMTDVWITLQHVEEHGSTTHEGFNIRHIIPSFKVYRQLCI